MYIIANVGDSRCIKCIKKYFNDPEDNDKLTYNIESEKLSFDHKPDNQEEKERIEKADGFVNAGRINGSISLSRALGDFNFKVNADK